jgi:hypothetical protein
MGALAPMWNIEEPDTLFTRERTPLLNKLIERNLVVDDIPPRSTGLWIDSPPPEKDADLGIRKHVAWQTSIHWEAVKTALKVHATRLATLEASHSPGGERVADQFLYPTAGLQAIGNSKLENWTYNSPFPWRETPSVECYPDPGIMLAHWTTSGSNIGRALVLNCAGVTALQNIGGSNARFCTTKFAPGGDKQSSIEYTFWPYSVTKTTSSGLQLKYWTVIFDMRSSGPGFGNYGQNEMWKNAYIYAPMFLKKKYAPTIIKP